jgi:hypothetical protein
MSVPALPMIFSISMKNLKVNDRFAGTRRSSESARDTTPRKEKGA